MRFLFSIAAFFVCPSFLWAGILDQPTPAAMPLEPLVYTGALHSADSDRSMLARMFIIPGSNHGPFEAHLILYHGSFDTREYVPIIFDKVEPQANGTYLLTSLRMTGGGMPMRHPVVDLGVPGNGSLDGVFHSGRQTRTGILRLVDGWELPPDIMAGRRVVPAFEGRYFGDCMGGPRDDMLTGVEIYSTRSQLDDIAMVPTVDTSLEANVYQGGTVCRDIDSLSREGDVSCMGFPSGHYDHYTGKLMLYFTGAWRWSCDFDEKNDMITCDTPRFGRRCELYRIRDREVMTTDTIGMKPLGLENTDVQMARIRAELSASQLPPSSTLSPSPSPSPPSAIKCSDMAKKFPGILHHLHTGLYQRVALDLVSSEASPGNCKISGMIAQSFDKADHGDEQPLTHVIDPSIYNSSEEVFRISSGQMGDAALILRREGLSFSGYWYSRLFGLVGRVEFGEKFSLESISTESFVPSVSGVFDSPPQNDVRIHRVLKLKSLTDSIDFRSFNPLRQLPTRGTLSSEVMTTDGNGYGIQTLMDVDNLVYDYFTGHMAFSTGSSEYYGPVLPRGLNLRVIPTNNGARYIPFGVRWEYSRIQN